MSKEYEEMKSLNGFTNDYEGMTPPDAKTIREDAIKNAYLNYLNTPPEPSAFLWTNPELKEMNEKLSDILEILKYIAINVEREEPPKEEPLVMAFCKVCNSHLQTPGELERMECNLCSGKKG